MASGNWSGEAPSCEKLKCGNPEIPEKGQIVRTYGALYGDTIEVSFICSTGGISYPCEKHVSWGPVVTRVHQFEFQRARSCTNFTSGGMSGSSGTRTRTLCFIGAKCNHYTTKPLKGDEVRMKITIP